VRCLLDQDLIRRAGLTAKLFDEAFDQSSESLSVLTPAISDPWQLDVADVTGTLDPTTPRLLRARSATH